MATTPKRRVRKYDAREIAARLADSMRLISLKELQVPGLWIITNGTPKLDKWSQIIIWDGWYGVPLRDRPEIAFDALSQFSPSIRDETYVIVCLTPDEAISMGYFPYRVEPIKRGIDDRIRDRIEKALLDEGAIETSEGLQLRFMSLDEVQSAFVRLQIKVPGPYWTIVEEVSRSG
jgi:hypothetical protein